MEPHDETIGTSAGAVTSFLAGVLGALFFSVTAVAPTVAAELKGFGPVTFDMSKQEAWDALGGKGRWATDVLLMFEFQPFSNARKFRAEVAFEDDRILYITIHEPIDQTVDAPPPDCIAQAVSISRRIQTRYGVKPTRRLVRAAPKMDLDFGVIPERDRMDLIEIFSFEGAAYIELKMLSRFKPGAHRGQCYMSLTYSPPSHNPTPF